MRRPLDKGVFDVVYLSRNSQGQGIVRKVIDNDFGLSISRLSLFINGYPHFIDVLSTVCGGLHSLRLKDGVYH